MMKKLTKAALLAAATAFLLAGVTACEHDDKGSNDDVKATVKAVSDIKLQAGDLLKDVTVRFTFSNKVKYNATYIPDTTDPYMVKVEDKSGKIDTIIGTAAFSDLDLNTTDLSLTYLEYTFKVTVKTGAEAGKGTFTITLKDGVLSGVGAVTGDIEYEIVNDDSTVTPGESNPSPEAPDSPTEDKDTTTTPDDEQTPNTPATPGDTNNTSKSITLNASDLSTGDITENTTFGDFTLIADSSNKMAVDSNDKTVDGIKYTKRLKTNGSGSKEKRAIKFSPTGPATIVIISQSGSSSENRDFAIANDDQVLFTGTALGERPEAVTFNYEGNGEDLYLYSTNSGINFYAIYVNSY